MMSEARKKCVDELKERNPLATLADTIGKVHPSWMRQEIWDELCQRHWLKDKWQQKSKAGQENRMKQKEGSITKHSGGSIPFVTHKRRMVIYLVFLNSY